MQKKKQDHQIFFHCNVQFQIIKKHYILSSNFLHFNVKYRNIQLQLCILIFCINIFTINMKNKNIIFQHLIFIISFLMSKNIKYDVLSSNFLNFNVKYLNIELQLCIAIFYIQIFNKNIMLNVN